MTAVQCCSLRSLTPGSSSFLPSTAFHFRQRRPNTLVRQRGSVMLTTRRTWLHRLFPWAFPRPAKRRRAAKPRSCRLELEHLVDRTLPTVLFNSALGGDTIFWVPNNSAGQPANQVQTGPISNNPSV